MKLNTYNDTLSATSQAKFQYRLFNSHKLNFHKHENNISRGLSEKI